MKTAIKTHLDARAASDPQFAERYNNPNKSLDECCKYITGEAFARAKNGTAVLSDDEVYGMAVHYYDEDNITIRKSPKAHTPEPTLSKKRQQELLEQAEREYKASVLANLKQQELDRKAAQREKAKAKREKEETIFYGSLFD